MISLGGQFREMLVSDGSVIFVRDFRLLLFLYGWYQCDGVVGKDAAATKVALE